MESMIVDMIPPLIHVMTIPGMKLASTFATKSSVSVKGKSNIDSAVLRSFSPAHESAAIESVDSNGIITKIERIMPPTIISKEAWRSPIFAKLPGSDNIAPTKMTG